MCISKPVIPTYAGLETNILNATQFLALTPESSDAGFVAIYSLLRLHHQIICGEADRMPFEVTVNSRILLQASMLARHLVARDKNKENRTFALLAARLHLNLGLGKDAFQLYQHAKCKEMLLDTLSPYILSRISMTHPFEVKGYQGFSADEELAKVVSTIERMENKTDAYIFNDMPNFISDQVTDALDLKRRLKSSLTKHLCTAERRRMARLKGESTENIPLSDHEGKSPRSDTLSSNIIR
jgi:N-terminal acetyltransferase B complex non-catalytic subunit